MNTITDEQLCAMAHALQEGGLSQPEIVAELFEKYPDSYTGPLPYPTAGWAAGLLRRHRQRMGGAPDNGSGASQDVAPDILMDLPGDLTFDDLIEIADSLRTVVNDVDPIMTHHEMTLGDGGPVGIVFSSCAHMGGRYTDHEAIREFIDTALEVPNLYWAPLGDDIEGYLSGFPDKKSVHEQPMNIGIQLIMLRAMIAKLASKKRLLLGTASQHGGKWFESRDGYNPVKDAYLKAGVPWFDGQVYIKLHVGEQTYHLAVSHEFPGHSMYNQLHSHARALRWNYPNADVVVQGDKHTYAVSEVTAYIKEFDAGNRQSPFAWFVQTGTAKTGLDRYTIKRWPHGILEWPVLIFESETHNIECTRHWRTVRAWLDVAASQMARAS